MRSLWANQRQELFAGVRAIATTAQDFGFSDQSHCTRVFKQVKGVTLRQFLKAL
ncbi:MAG: AraC family transcriptional regulator [Spirulinaceae cyanobacterium SM2_1_0]|nr:AraC family transcriptional regulator [Spirulinaceae cyanobacterium SM2_1_0]